MPAKDHLGKSMYAAAAQHGALLIKLRCQQKVLLAGIYAHHGLSNCLTPFGRGHGIPRGASLLASHIRPCSPSGAGKRAILRADNMPPMRKSVEDVLAPNAGTTKSAISYTMYGCVKIGLHPHRACVYGKAAGARPSEPRVRICGALTVVIGHKGLSSWNAVSSLDSIVNGCDGDHGPQPM